MLKGAPGTAGLNPPPPDPFAVGVAGFGVVDLPSSDLFAVEGAGVEEAEERPLRGEAGSFFALPLEAAEAGPSPFSLGGVRRKPFCCGETALTCGKKSEGKIENFDCVRGATKFSLRGDL